MNIREEIRNILLEVIFESEPSIHYKDRVYGRLTSTLYTRPVFDYSTVKSEIDTVKKINFPEGESYAVMLKSYPVTYVSKDPETGKTSIGNELWLVVRDNIITTIFFRQSSQKGIKVSNVDNIINVSTLYKHYKSSEKNPDGTVDYQPSKVGFRKRKRRGVDLDLPVVLIKGKEWFVDEDNEKIIYSKNIKNTKSFEELEEEELEKVINVVVK